MSRTMTDAPEIYIDADACPVRREILRVAERHGLVVHIVSNRGFRTGSDPRVRNVLVPEGPDAADDWIAERVRPGDIVITGDIPLADRVIKAGGRAIGNDGRPFTEQGIGAVLATRDLMAHLRDTGAILGGGGRAMNDRDRQRLVDALEAAVRDGG